MVVRRSLLLPVSALTCLSVSTAACVPNVERAVAPSVSVGAWRDPGAAGSPGTVPLAAGWTAFGSPALVALIARARRANADIAVAAARVVQARGQLGVARAAGLPSVSAFADARASGTGGGRGYRDNTASAGLDIAYDVDLFGGARGERRAALARLTASGYDRDAVALAIEGDVARAFVQGAALTARLDILGRALGNARELDRIIGVRVREGAATRVESGLQTIEVRRIQAEMSRLAEAGARTRNALAILVGAEAPAFDAGDADLQALAVPDFEAAQPGILLVRRPDVRAAEARVAAAAGDIDRARAAFLPALRISAGLLLGTGGGGPLGFALSAGSALLAPIFDGGRLRGALLATTGAQRESVELYRRALLTALAEVQDALGGIAQSRARGDLLGGTMTVARTTARLARRQYVEGAADLQTVLDAERRALDIEDAAAVAAQDRLDAAIDLYRALGGDPATRG